MNIKKEETEYQEAVYREIHYDENGKEYYKDAVTTALPLKLLPFVYAMFFISLAVIAAFISPIIAFIVLIPAVITIKPVKSKLIEYLLKTGKYYDNINL